MNIFVRFGQWLERRRVLRLPDLLEIKSNYQNQANAFQELIERQAKRIDTVEELVKIPSDTAKEFALIKARLNQLELYVGLKREPGPVHVKGEARIG